MKSDKMNVKLKNKLVIRLHKSNSVAGRLKGLFKRASRFLDRMESNVLGFKSK
jgi:hypothetical protein